MAPGDAENGEVVKGGGNALYPTVERVYALVHSATVHYTACHSEDMESPMK